MEILVDSIEMVDHEDYKPLKTLAINGTQRSCFYSESSCTCYTWCPLFYYQEITEQDIGIMFEVMQGERKQVTLCQDRVYYTEKPLHKV